MSPRGRIPCHYHRSGLRRVPRSALYRRDRVEPGVFSLQLVVVNLMRNPLRRLRRAIGYLARHLRQRRIVQEHGVPSSILYFQGGVGDQLLSRVSRVTCGGTGRSGSGVLSQTPSSFPTIPMSITS